MLRICLSWNDFFAIKLDNLHVIFAYFGCPLVISAKPVFDSGQEGEAEFYLFLVVLRLTGTGRGVELEKVPKKLCFQV